MCVSSDRPVFMSDEINSGSPMRQRYKLWEIYQGLYCSVIGTCLTVDELRRACKRSHNNIDTDVSDYELHKKIVHIAGQPLQISRYLNKALDRKYKSHIRQIGQTWDPENLKKYWQKSVKRGDVPGAYWALVTHPGISQTLLDMIYGEIHMLSHDLGKGRHQMLHTAELNQSLLKSQQADTQLLKAEIQKKVIIIAEQQVQITVFEEKQKQCKKLDRKLQQYESNTLEISQRQKNEDLVEKLSLARSKVERYQQYGDGWKQQYQALARANNQLLSEPAQGKPFHPSEQKINRQVEVTADCQHCDLGGQCILYVGGRQSQCSHYREVVEQNNGRFLYHDGGLEQSPAELDSVLCRADVVFCPVDRVSHSAMHRVKTTCKNNDVPVQFLKTSSMSMFVDALKGANS